MGLERKERARAGMVGIQAEAFRFSPGYRGEGWRLGAQDK